MGEEINNEKGEHFKTNKHQYALTGIEDTTLNNMVYDKGKNVLSDGKKDILRNYEFDAVVISAKGNENFDFVDMFVRLNKNTRPLSINSFEMWNSFEIVDVIRRIKEISKYKLLKQPGKRMLEEELVTILAYLDYKKVSIYHLDNAFSITLKTYNRTKKNEITQAKLSLYRNKSMITSLLEKMEAGSKEEKEFMQSVESVNEFIDKLKILSGDDDEKLLKIFNPNTNHRKFAQKNDFYIMWLILKELDTHILLTYRKDILKDLENVFRFMKDMPNHKDEDDFITHVKGVIEKHTKHGH